MTDEGTGGAFVNPHGYVHDMITLRQARHVTLEGQPETEHSWFKGYAWTIGYCEGCTSHLVSYWSYGHHVHVVHIESKPVLYVGCQIQFARKALSISRLLYDHTVVPSCTHSVLVHSTICASTVHADV